MLLKYTNCRLTFESFIRYYHFPCRYRSLFTFRRSGLDGTVSFEWRERRLLQRQELQRLLVPAMKLFVSARNSNNPEAEVVRTAKLLISRALLFFIHDHALYFVRGVRITVKVWL